MKKVFIATLGCKSNQFDSAIIEENILRSGFQVVTADEPADIYIINTCTVTRKADYQSRQLIRRFQRKNANALVIVTGCYAQVNPHEIGKIPGVDYILGNREKDKIEQYLLRLKKRDKPQIQIESITGEKKLEYPLISRFPHHSRAFVKIQDGCNRHCTYCIIPYARGSSRSLEHNKVLRQIELLGRAGYREVVLSGINLGSYGADFHTRFSLSDLLLNIEKQRPIERVRISSLNPDEISEGMINQLASSNILCSHLHISLQNGDDWILKRMGRNYTSEFFSELVMMIKSRIPEISIGVDIIVGFPGEGEENFNNTYKLLEVLPISYLHIFPFSKRINTPAAKFSNQVNGQIIKERSHYLKGLDQDKRKQFYQDFIGKKCLVLVEKKKDSKNGLLRGYSRNYLPVLLKGSDELMGREVEVKISRFEGEKLYTELISDSS
ncbi:MAG: tRNA (N(6)-L-threonylcarbamoyladenosine(37)-C(2))-methylthiotransferase MtaB [Deltaproteobacteria bacterium]|nr:MAG: tRNA (N(6)-L-threonylcarbamoyladenosine(37)-C(2))-methylthiotransferase MtaB [Deltaproteobacteria bacterium]